VTDAYVTEVTLTTVNGVAHTEEYSYGYNDSELTESTDENSQTTTYKYNDNLSRLTETDFPDNGETTLAYNDLAPSPTVTTTKLISSSVSVTTIATMDGIGHPVQTELSTDPDNPTYTATTYDGLGHPYTVTNPYRTTGDSTYGTTTHNYDGLGRTTQITEPDGSIVSTSYSANSSQFLTTVTDEVGNQRVNHTDGLGRLTEVDEPSNVPSSPATATIGITGSGIESVQTSPAEPGTASITITGAENAVCVCTPAWCNGPPSPPSTPSTPPYPTCQQHYYLYYDSGIVYITVNGNTDSYAYNQEDTDVAAGLAAAINADSKSLVTATATIVRSP